MVSAQGISPDPAKVKGVVDMPAPTDQSGVRRFLGMVNQLSKFSKKIAELSKPIRDLLVASNMFVWGPQQQNAFEEIKRELSSPNALLAHYNAEAKTVVSTDASSYGLGAVLLQESKKDEWRPVGYISRSRQVCSD